MLKIKFNKKAFTLIELLISISIFTFVILSALTIFINISQAKKRNEIDTYLVTEGRFLMEKIVRDIKKGTIDFDQYFNSKINNDRKANEDNSLYGAGYGEYAKKFFYFGSDGLAGYKMKFENLDDYKKIIDKSSIDIDTGENPALSASTDDVAKVTAFTDGSDDIKTQDFIDHELFLIESDGEVRNFYRYDASSESVKLLKLSGIDGNQDGIADAWKCTDDWLDFFEIEKSDPQECTTEKDVSNNFINNSKFIDLTPENIKIKDLKFVLSPLEDPFKAIKEGTASRSQPRVTVILSLQSSDPFFSGKTTISEIHLQTTISTQVYYNIPSYNRFFDNES